MTDDDSQTTPFGYSQVPIDQKVDRVREVFDSVSSKYDVMNDLMSLGLHRIWKRFATGLCGVRSGEQVLDLAAGTGDLTRLLVRQAGPTGRVVMSDINRSMLEQGRDRLLDQGITAGVELLQANAEHLPLADNSFDCIIIGFGLRNVTDKQAALTEMHRVLKPGGRALILEFSKPISPLQKPYDIYSFKILPLLGKLIAKDADSYRYLAESIRMHPDQQTLKGMMEQAGLSRCHYYNLAAGIVAVHRGYKL
ncbi:MAG: bifunctional demethylmenaquinone methyltransferase/2-methoxy-6-polyprenyl-1,4-benzoquinol methylase UbiE [Gammaproteobacteria bacterium]|nr:MAG: bifunctional demethylmenaquinone methyltransferase/2-methoxy-6-polyprenyl-1,4-benzoquinol methylase UbiE [Gammaproteobacteria bacterium]RLA14618.1 MAG: bifunctional demethylmenaquinone methyltransferase/2-methoxy-6-polyprenyl-1,4-benzoquinol methylase UbiE [Gammaproteobacteria bacterium]